MAFVILYLFKFLHGKQGFCSFGISMCRIFALTFNFIVPTLAVPNEVHCESVQKSSGSLKGHLVRNSQPSLVHVTVVSVMLVVEQLSAKTNRSSEVNCCGHQASKTKTKLWDREEKVTLLITNLSFIYAVNFTRCGRNRNLWQKERGNPREGGGRVLPWILDRGALRRFLNPEPIKDQESENQYPFKPNPIQFKEKTKYYY